MFEKRNYEAFTSQSLKFVKFLSIAQNFSILLSNNLFEPFNNLGPLLSDAALLCQIGLACLKKEIMRLLSLIV